MSASPEQGLDLAVVDGYLKGAGVPRRGELRADPIAGGRSNLSFSLSDEESRWVLRMPPAHGLTPSAHDMTREYRIVSALQDSAVPVPGVVVLEADSAPLGAPFQIVEFVEGRVVRTRDDLALLGSAAVEGCADSLISVLAEVHNVDVEAVGLAAFGRPQGFLERQVSRWSSQWGLIAEADDPRGNDVERLRGRLESAVPAPSRTALLHGDFRIDNTILDADDPTRVRAVVDWELATVGDPLADVALMCVYRDPVLDAILDLPAAWSSPLWPTGDELAHLYSIRAGHPLLHWGFHLALASFKLAIIAAGIDFRARSANGGREARLAGPATAVGPLIHAGLAALRC